MLFSSFNNMCYSNSTSFLVQVCSSNLHVGKQFFVGCCHVPVRADTESSPVILTVAVLQAQSQEDQRGWVAAINVRRVLQFVL